MSKNISVIKNSGNPQKTCQEVCRLIFSHYEQGRLSAAEAMVLLKSSIVQLDDRKEGGFRFLSVCKKPGAMLAIFALIGALLGATFTLSGAYNSAQITVLIFSCFINLILGGMVFAKNPKSQCNKIFFATSIVLTGFLLTNFMSLHPLALAQITWIRLQMVSVVSFVLGYYLIILLFPNRLITQLSQFQKSVIGLSLILIGLCLTPTIFVATTQAPNARLGNLFFLILVQQFGLIVLTIYEIYKKSKVATKTRKLQLVIIAVGILFSFFGIFVFNFIFVQVLNTTAFIYLSNLATLAFTASFAYVVFYKKMFDKIQRLKKLSGLTWITVIGV
ncbi:hypothetical protein HYX70_04755 [Candidatus Saccharibacteria bacterium]|nr:hypothetical protein [Candidatus Saccharibacteria bacterium]